MSGPQQKRSRANTAGDDGDTSQPTTKLWTALEPPPIVCFSHEALVKWRRERELYEAAVIARCQESGESLATVMRPVISTIHRRLLKTFCELELKMSVSEMTNDRLVTAINQILATMMNDQIPNVHAIMNQHLRMDLRQKDVKARVLNYFDKFDELIEEYGLSVALDDNEKLKCRLLTENLRPSGLKEQVLLYQDLDPTVKISVPRLFDVIKAEALKNQQSFDLFHSTRDRGSARTTKTAPYSNNGDRNNYKSQKGDQLQPAREDRRDERPMFKKRDAAPAQGCLHCKGTHWVSDCPSATDEQKKAAREAFKERMNRRRDAEASKMKRVLGDGEDLAPMHVAFNGVVTMPYFPDNGTKYNVIPRRIVEELQQACPDVKVERLRKPIDGKAVGGAIISCDESIQLDLELITSAGKVRMRKVTCIITETEEDEFLLGRLTLKALGIDVEGQLSALANREIVDFDPFESETPMSFDPPDKKKIIAQLCELINEAVANGFPAERKRELFEVVMRYDIWRIAIGNDPPSKIEPFVIQFKEGTLPIRCRPRTYAPAEREWMKAFNESLVKLGWVYRNEASRWASPARPVKKPGKTGGLRQAVDFRRPNKQVLPVAGSMPSLSTRLHHTKNKKHRQTVDFLKSFWQMALAKVSQESQSYMTEDGVFTPTRLQQGSVDSSIHFQQSIEKIMREANLLYEHVLAWIDDLLIYADTIDEFLSVLDRVYCTLEKNGLFLGLNKICLYTTEAKWCGRIIKENGIAYDHERIQTLIDLPEPKTAAELQQFLCAAGWMRNALVDFARVAAPLQARLQTALEGTKRTKHVAARVAIDFTAEERKSFGQVKQLLAKSATLVTPDDSDELILMTDASDAGWSIIVTAVENWDPATSIIEQQHQLVHCMSGTFKGAAQHWSVSEKEAFPIIKAATDLDYLLIRSKGFRLYSDHRNLIFIFAPGDEIKKHVRGKLQRWSLKLNELRYTIEHISGKDNVWADMASRWACIELPRETTTVKRWQTQDPHVQVELRPLRPDSEWPTEDDIKCAQLATKCTRPPHLEEQPNGLWRDEQNRLWIPEDAEVLLMRLMVIAHCGTMGHRGVNVMINHLQEHFHLEKLEPKARAFCSRCLLCCHVKGGKIIPRPWGETYRSNERNEALHMDYLFIGDYNGESNYLLVMKDDFSHYCELIECSSANAATAAMAILDWNSRYGMPQLLISDTATHFKNQLLEELCHKTQMTQSFTLAYCPWINGSVERLNRDILQVLRVMLLEYKVEQDNWAALLPLIQANLNHSPVASLANHAPAEVFLGVKAKTPLQKILIGSDAIAANVVTTGDFSPGVREAVGNLRASLDGMHREVATAKEKQTKRNQRNQRGARSVNFHVGDYVLWSRVDAKKKGNKLSVTWVGPYRVIGANTNSFEIEHLITATTKFAHASRLKMYADQSLDVNEEMLAHIANQDIYLTVEAFTQHRKHSTHTYEILVRWEGLEAIEDSWEPVTTMYEDVPIKLQDYVDSAADDELRQFVIQLRSHSQGRKRTEATVQPTPSHRRGKRGGDVAAQTKPPKLNRRQRRAKGNTKK